MTDPFYTDDWVTLYHGDALHTPEWLAADVLVTDPPYGVAFQSAWRSGDDRFERIAGDDSTELRDATLRLWNGFDARPAIVFGTWRAERPAGVRQRLIWAKGDDPGLGDLGFPWGYGDEEMYVMGGGLGWQEAHERLSTPEGSRVEQPWASDAEAGGAHGGADRALPGELGGRRPLRRLRRDPHRSPQPRPESHRRRAGRTLLRADRHTPREHSPTYRGRRPTGAHRDRSIRAGGVT